MSTSAPIDDYYSDQSQVIKILSHQSEISLAQTVHNIFAKSLILISASYFEAKLREIVLSCITRRTSNDDIIVNFCQNKGIYRQYNTRFDWDAKNTNKFFKLFGENFATLARRKLSEDQNLADSEKDFVYIGAFAIKLLTEIFLHLYFRIPMRKYIPK